MSQSTAICADIDFEALASNVGLIRQIAGSDKQLIASIKANAYGHGVVPIAQALQDLKVDALATVSKKPNFFVSTVLACLYCCLLLLIPS